MLSAICALLMAFGWKLVDPDGRLHIVSGEGALSELCTAHGLNLSNVRHMCDMFEGNGTAAHVNQWVRLESVRWLRMELSDELVPVLGSAEHFLTKVAEKRTDMPFALAAFRKLLSGTLRSHGTPTDTYTMYKWRVVPAPVDAAQRFPLASLPATDQMDVDVMPDAELQAVLLAAGNPPTAASAASAAFRRRQCSCLSEVRSKGVVEGVRGRESKSKSKHV